MCIGATRVQIHRTLLTSLNCLEHFKSTPEKSCTIWSRSSLNMFSIMQGHRVLHAWCLVSPLGTAAHPPTSIYAGQGDALELSQDSMIQTLCPRFPPIGVGRSGSHSGKNPAPHKLPPTLGTQPLPLHTQQHIPFLPPFLLTVAAVLG